MLTCAQLLNIIADFHVERDYRQLVNQKMEAKLYNSALLPLTCSACKLLINSVPQYRPTLSAEFSAIVRSSYPKAGILDVRLCHSAPILLWPPTYIKQFWGRITS